MILRPVTDADHARIIDIWNQIIRDTDLTFNSVEKTVQSLKQELEQKAELGHPFFVATVDNTVLGFATYGQFRASSGYARSMEHTIILSNEARSKGIGRTLMREIEDHARARQIHSMLACVSHRNTAAIKFHLTIGFREVARVPEIGWKFDQWYDLVLMQKIL